LRWRQAAWRSENVIGHRHFTGGDERLQPALHGGIIGILLAIDTGGLGAVILRGNENSAAPLAAGKQRAVIIRKIFNNALGSIQPTSLIGEHGGAGQRFENPLQMLVSFVGIPQVNFGPDTLTTAEIVEPFRRRRP